MGSIEPWAHESRSANSSDSEATAGIETRDEGFADFSLDFRTDARIPLECCTQRSRLTKLVRRRLLPFARRTHVSRRRPRCPAPSRAPRAHLCECPLQG